MKKTIIASILLLSQLSFSQIKNDTISRRNTTKRRNANNRRKGQFFASWGWNRDSYSKSDIRFKGNGYDFTIEDAVADDKPNPFGIKFFSPGDITLPQTNLVLGYFFKDNYNVVIGFDHMKYVMRQNQDAIVNGTIQIGNPDFDGVYTNQTVTLTEDFLKFEHTDGLNYAFVGVNRFDNFNELLRINTPKFEVNLEEGLAVGLLYPKTNTTLLGKERYDEFHVSGYGVSAKVGLNLTFFRHFYLQTDFKLGYINMQDIRTTKSTSDKASQHFYFYETAYTFGYRFQLF
jgi:hypothetical protein